MYELTKEDIQNLVNYREYLKSVRENCNDEAYKMLLTKSIELLEGNISSQTMLKYLENVKSNKGAKAELSEETKAANKAVIKKADEFHLHTIINKIVKSLKK